MSEAASSVDSELAALLDEELFRDDDACTAEPAPAAEQQQSKRPRLDEQPTSTAAGPPAYGASDDLEDMPGASDDDEQDASPAAAEYVCPPHPGWWMGLCIRCGAARREDEPAQPQQHSQQHQQQRPSSSKQPQVKIKHLRHQQALEIAAHEAARIASDYRQKLISQRRMVLVLDLDHTLLNTVKDAELLGPEREAAFKQLEAQHKAWQQQQQQLQGQPLQQGQQQEQQEPAVAAGGDGQQQEQEHQQEQQEEAAESDEEPDPWDDPSGTAAAAPAAEAVAGADAAAADSATPAAAPATAADQCEQPGQQPPEQQEQEHPHEPAEQPQEQPAGQEQQQEQPQDQPEQPPVSSWPGYGPRGQLYCFRDKGLWTKLRPGVGAFLQAVSELYELHIYTMGDKGYAALMADVLDPEHRLFVGRVISSADSTDSTLKDLDVLMADESLVLILDDSEHVWQKHRANLIQVDRYHYFNASVRQFHPQAVSKLSLGTDEPLQGGMLDTAQQLLARIHARVFGSSASSSGGDSGGADSVPAQPQTQQLQEEAAAAAAAAAAGQIGDPQQQQQQALPGIRRVVRRPNHQQPAAAAAAAGAGGGVLGHNDVRECLRVERRTVLQDCCIVFSRCWPQDTSPPAHPLWQLAESLGASCSLKIQPGRTTHLVVPPEKGQPPLTDKVQAANKAGIPVVHPDWLLACMFSWRQMPATDFVLGHYSTVPGSSWCSRRWLGPVRRDAGAAYAAERMAVLRAAGRVG